MYAYKGLLTRKNFHGNESPDHQMQWDTRHTQLGSSALGIGVSTMGAGGASAPPMRIRYNLGGKEF